MTLIRLILLLAIIKTLALAKFSDQLCSLDNITIDSLHPCPAHAMNITAMLYKTASATILSRTCRHTTFGAVNGTVCDDGCLNCLALGENCRNLPWFNASNPVYKNCNCSSSSFNQTTSCKVISSYVPVIEVVDLTIGYIPGTLIYPIVNPYPFQEIPSSKRSTENVVDVVTFNIPEIILFIPSTLPPTSVITVSWLYVVHSGWFDCEIGECSYILDRNMFTTAGSLFVRVFINDTLDSSYKFIIAPEDVCMHICTFCSEFFDKYDCQPTWAKILFWVVSTVLVLLVIVGIVLMVKCCCACCPASPIVVRQNFDLEGFNRRIRNWRSGKSREEDDEIEMPTQDEIEEFQEDERKRKRREWMERHPERFSGISKIHSCLLIVTIVLLLASPASAQDICTTGLIISSDQSTCYVNLTHETCTFSTSALIVLPYLNSISCITFTSGNTGNVMGTLALGYFAMYKDISLQHNYYTSSWTALTASGRSCHNSANCGSGECAAYNGTPPDKNMIGAPATNFPGKSICTSQCGCAGCGCFFCDSSCVYSRFGLQPVGNVAQVLTPFSTQKRPAAIWLLQNGTETISGSLDVSTGSATLNGTLQVSVLGSLDSGDTEFGARKIIVHNGVAYIGAASESNAPNQGIPGDVQGNGVSSFTSPSISSFIFDPQVCIPQTNTESTSYTCRSPGLPLLQTGQYTQLPAVIGSTLYTYADGVLVGFDNNPGALLLSLSMDEPIHFSQTVNIVCPDISDLFVSGCYQCLEGAQFVITARSTCSPGLATISIVSNNQILLNQYSVSLTSNFNATAISFTSADKYIEGTIFYRYGTHSSSKYFRSTLNDPSGISNPNDTAPPGWNTDNDNSFGSWFMNLAYPWNIIRWVIIAIIIVAILIGLAFLGYIVWYYKFNPGYKPV